MATVNPIVLERLKLKRAKENGTESFAMMQKREEGKCYGLCATFSQEEILLPAHFNWQRLSVKRRPLRGYIARYNVLLYGLNNQIYCDNVAGHGTYSNKR